MKQESIKFENFISIIFLILPAALISGPFLSDLIVSIMSLYFIFILTKRRLVNILKNKFVILFLSFYIYVLLLSLISKNIFLSLESSLFYFRFLFFSLCIAYLINNDHNLKDKLKYSFFITLTFLVFDAYLQFFSGKNILGFNYSYNRVSSFFNDELVLGSYLARMMPILLGLVATTSLTKKNEVYYAFCLLIAIDVLTFLSGERTAFSLITFATIILILTIKNFSMIRLTSFIISSILIFIIMFTFDDVKERMVDQTLNQTGLSNGEQVHVFSEEHNKYYVTAIEMFKERPLIGHGPKMYREVCQYEKYSNLNACSTHPHNNYIQSLAELGLIGTTPIIFLFFFISSRLIKHFYFRIFHRKYLYSDYEVCLYVAIILTLWPFAPTGNLFNNWLNIIYFMPVGLLLAEKIKFR